MNDKKSHLKYDDIIEIKLLKMSYKTLKILERKYKNRSLSENNKLKLNKNIYFAKKIINFRLKELKIIIKNKYNIDNYYLKIKKKIELDAEKELKSGYKNIKK